MHYNLRIALYNLQFIQYTSHIALYTLYLKLKIRLHLVLDKEILYKRLEEVIDRNTPVNDNLLVSE